MSTPPKNTSKEARKALHKAKMMGKHFRRYESGVTELQNALASGKRIRPNVSNRVLKARLQQGTE